MSFELFLQSFSAGQAAGIPLAELRAAFGTALSELEDDFWQVEYAADQSSDLFLRPLPSDAGLIHTLSIYRPCTDARLYESIWQLLGRRGTCLYFPGGAAPLARDEALAEALPGDMLRALGQPVLLRSPAQIALAIVDET